MSLRQFLNAAYTLIVDAFRETGNDLLRASEKAQASIGLGPPVEASPEAGNELALRELERAMGGL